MATDARGLLEQLGATQQQAQAYKRYGVGPQRGAGERAKARELADADASARQTALAASKVIGAQGGITDDPGQAYQAGQDAIDMARGGYDPAAAYQGQTPLAQQQQARMQEDRSFEMQQRQQLLAAQDLEMEAQQMEREGGRYGSNWSEKEWTPAREARVGLQQNVDNAQYIMDVVENTTPDQLKTRVMAGPRGKLSAALYTMYPAVQKMGEAKESTLRESERDAIDNFLGDPASFISGMLSHDAATIAKFKVIQDVSQRGLDSQLVGLDDKTVMLLGKAAPRNEDMYGFQTPKNASIRDARGPETAGPMSEADADLAVEDWMANPQGLL